MIDPEVQNLLTLQARELKRDEIQRELAAIPIKIQEIESEKKAARDRFEVAKQTLRNSFLQPRCTAPLISVIPRAAWCMWIKTEF